MDPVSLIAVGLTAAVSAAAFALIALRLERTKGCAETIVAFGGVPLVCVLHRGHGPEHWTADGTRWIRSGDDWEAWKDPPSPSYVTVRGSGDT